jgi:hypothetical protein
MEDVGWFGLGFHEKPADIESAQWWVQCSIKPSEVKQTTEMAWLNRAS